MLLQRRDLIDIAAITVVAGNHTVPQGSEHMLHQLELCAVSYTHLTLPTNREV